MKFNKSIFQDPLSLFSNEAFQPIVMLQGDDDSVLLKSGEDWKRHKSQQSVGGKADKPSTMTPQRERCDLVTWCFKSMAVLKILVALLTSFTGKHAARITEKSFQLIWLHDVPFLCLQNVQRRSAYKQICICT